jgi:hypothetical protein
MMASRLANRIATLIARLPLAALLAVTVPAVHAQAFRCQYEDGHVEYSQSTCPFGTKALNVARPNLKQAASRGTPASAPAPAPKASPAQAGQLDDPGPDGQAPITWSMVDIDYKGVTVRTLFDKLAQLVGKKVVVDAGVRDRVVVAQYHDVPWDEAVADIAARAGLDVRDDGKTLTVKKKR